MVSFIQRGEYSLRWRLLWHVTHIEAKRVGQMPKLSRVKSSEESVSPPSEVERGHFPFMHIPFYWGDKIIGCGSP